MTKNFKTLDELQKYIERNVVPKFIENGQIESVLQTAMRKAVYEAVYQEYTPREYKRRNTKGGLGDRNLMQITNAILVDGNFSIMFENLAKGNDTLRGEFLAETIEEGIRSNWNNPNGEWSKPRPFTDKMYENILANPRPLIEAVKKAFKSAGFKVS